MSEQGKWRVAHGSVAGLSHVNQNTECQDRFSVGRVEKDGEEILIAVVADGAGSTSSGQRGAEIACKHFVGQAQEFLKIADLKSLSEDFGRLWIEFVQTEIAKIADEEKKEIREFASTLVGAIVGKDAAIFYQVGDGAAVFSVDGKPGSYNFSLAPLESEYVNATDFLTDETATENLRFVRLEEKIEDLILFSDGIFAVAVDYQTGNPHEPFLMPMIAPLRKGNEGDELNKKLEEFLRSPKLDEKTDDDKTIILASRKRGSEEQNLRDER